MSFGQRVSVYIPLSLHEKLQEFKSDLNISNICQTALYQAIKIAEIKQRSSSVMDALIEKIRQEQIEASQESYEQGIKDGLEDAQELSYKEFRQIEKCSTLNETFRDWLAEERIQYMEDCEVEQYFTGWTEGVLQVWEQIKNTIS